MSNVLTVAYLSLVVNIAHDFILWRDIDLFPILFLDASSLLVAL